MSNLDPALQRALTEYVEHQNERIRFGRKYGVWVALAMLAVFGGFAYWVWSSSQRDVAEMHERHHRDVEEMRQRHEQRVEEMRQNREQLLQGQRPPSAP